MNFIKKQSLGFWAYVVVAVLAVVCLVFYVLNVNQPYYDDMDVSIVYMMVGAVVALAASLALPQLGDNVIVKILADVCRVAASALIILAGASFIGMRVESFGYIYGSNLELGNEGAFVAGGQAITTIVLFVVTWVLSLVASFPNIVKKG